MEDTRREMEMLVMQRMQRGAQKSGFASSKGVARKGKGLKTSKVSERPSKIATKECPVGSIIHSH